MPGSLPTPTAAPLAPVSPFLGGHRSCILQIRALCLALLPSGFVFELLLKLGYEQEAREMGPGPKK